ncbi:hypothetical protein [Victivallis vadensis]
MNLQFPQKTNRPRIRLISRKQAFFLGVFVGYMLPMWIKILTK